MLNRQWSKQTLKKRRSQTINLDSISLTVIFRPAYLLYAKFDWKNWVSVLSSMHKYTAWTIRSRQSTVCYIFFLRGFSLHHAIDDLCPDASEGPCQDTRPTPAVIVWWCDIEQGEQHRGNDVAGGNAFFLAQCQHPDKALPTLDPAEKMPNLEDLWVESVIANGIGARAAWVLHPLEMADLGSWNASWGSEKEQGIEKERLQITLLVICSIAHIPKLRFRLWFIDIYLFIYIHL